MAIQAIAQLKAWFRTGLYPTESQFADLIDSFRHKQDKIDMSDVEGLGTAINNKLPKSEFESLVKKVNGIVDNTDVLRNIKQGVNDLTDKVGRYIGSDYKSVRQLNKIEFDDSVAVAVEQAPTDMGGVVEYFASCGFVLKASDGKYYADWSNRWWFYTDSGQVRTDVLYLYDNRLWHWTGTTLIDLIGKSIADQDSERLLLMAGKYGGRTADGAVTLNGVTLSADDLVQVMALGYWEPTRKTNGLSVRTNLPPLDSGGYASPDMYAALVNSSIEVLNVRTQTADGLYVSALRYAFSGCQHLREIQGEIKVSGVTSFDHTFAGCSALEEVRLTGVAADISLADSPLLSWDSFVHLVSNAKGTSPVTVTLHPTAYDRITGDDRYDNIYGIIFNKQITVGKP